MSARGFVRRHIFLLSSVVLAVVIVAGSALLVWPREPVSDAQVERSSLPVAASPPAALFIGDSFTATADLGEMSYACMAATEMGWKCDLAALPGTGYFSGGSANRFVVNPYTGQRTTSYSERITELATTNRPDYVVLDGGRNDVFAPASVVYGEMVNTLARAREAWPDAQIVLVRPRELVRPADDLGYDDAFFARLGAEPAARGVVFVDPLADPRFERADTSQLVGADGRHPNQEGTDEMGAALVTALTAAATAAKW
ncbi:SGNH/GDSL hydrolase family protein [Aldersonia sp. NBC_00410]|uniref:SGNH/GDSL hydrolase family protein n=1 Tax=Aldersonia sp. NBC_00410 TaxID=2975954 RepID=UPI0022502CAF|nr:SGNH/GDSL hydrolase family protein [Aldersonia sp. NBC_00410]MCX5041696.1 SGNH/GDSL hydrolase family protein [Aldersonia sp. NBC_00410]